MYPDFVVFENHMRETCKWVCSEKQIESESTEYGAMRFRLSGKQIIFRTAKTTPAKTGQFVTLWKRDQKGNTAPFDEKDAFDVCIIFCRLAEKTGQFIFPKDILLAKGIISGKKSAGKRGIRIYPCWDVPQNKQAQQTQAWQVNYFIETTEAYYEKRFEAILKADS